MNTVHFTPWGLCLHDYSIDPCEYHLKCLEGCLDYLADIVGETTTEDVLDVIFEQFCLGK